jgi:hypothetical protein
MMLEPGPELDQTVAVAVGIEGRIGDDGFARLARPNSRDYLVWSPSTDLKTAFAAAEKVGLFDPGGLTCFNGIWMVSRLSSDVTAPTCVIAEAPTPALAICEAILELKEAE